MCQSTRDIEKLVKILNNQVHFRLVLYRKEPISLYVPLK